MRTRFSLGLVMLSAAIVVGGTPAAWGGWLSDLGFPPSRLAALAARQDLCDEVAVATADGRLDGSERSEILADAKSILKPDEYQAFKRAVDRRWPPPPKKPTAKHPPKTTRKATGPSQPAQAKPPAGPSLGLVIPAGALLPDWIVPGGVSR